MTVTIQLQWQRLPSPSVNGLVALFGAGSVRQGTHGVQQASDDRGLFVWNAGQMQYYDYNTGVWSGPHTLNGGNGNPGAWAPDYNGAVLYWDLFSHRYTSLNLVSGEEAYLDLPGTINTRFAFKDRSATIGAFPFMSWSQYLNDFGGGAAPLYWVPQMRGYVTTALHSVISTASILLLINYKAPLFPRVISVVDLGILLANNSVDLWWTSHGARVQTAGASLSDNMGLLPGRMTKRSPTVVSPPDGSGDFCDLSLYWNFSNMVAAAKWIGWDDLSGNPPVMSAAVPQTLSNAAIANAAPDNFTAFLGMLGSNSPYVVQGDACYVQAIASGATLQQVAWVPYNIEYSAFGPLPITLPPPAGFGVGPSSWAVFAIGGIPHILDANLNFYSLAMAQWDSVRHVLGNWKRNVLQ